MDRYETKDQLPYHVAWNNERTLAYVANCHANDTYELGPFSRSGEAEAAAARLNEEWLRRSMGS